MDGLLNLNKPCGWTSFQVVKTVRKLSGERKVGHTGTLDPSARGVLLLCLGKATKVSSHLLAEDKEYLARIRLGETTDTDDATGRRLSSSPIPLMGRGRMEEICMSFVGETEQTPPLFSALKFGGERLYKIARRGGSVELKPRMVEIKKMSLINYELPIIEIRVACSKGTYIRALARDIGRKAGCGAYLLSLVRTRLGDFSIEDALEIEELRDAEDVKSHLLPVGSGLRCPRLTVEDSDLARVSHGVALNREELRGAANLVEGETLLLENRNGGVVALARVTGSLIKPFRVLV